MVQGVLLHRSHWRTLFFAVWFGSIWTLGALSSTPTFAASASVEARVAEGLEAFHNGAFAQAIASWTEAARLYEGAAKPNEQSGVLIQLAQAYQLLGQYQEAAKNLNTALALVRQSGDQARLAMVLGSLGQVYSALDLLETAQQYFDEGLNIARELGNAGLLAVMLNNVSTMYASQGQYEEATRSYQESAVHAQANRDHLLAAKALANAASVSLQTRQYQAAKTLLDRAGDHLQNVDPAHDKAYQSINIGLTYQGLRAYLSDSSASLLLQAATQFRHAASTAETIGDIGAASYAWGYLGSLYEEEQRYQEALQLTQRAIFFAQQVRAPESLYLWQWQTGRILKMQRDVEGAISAYKQAVDTLQSIRDEMVVWGRHTSFRKSVGPVYFELVDLLLQNAAATLEPSQRTADLSEARQIVELLKAAELRDYFQDDCVDTARSETRMVDELIGQTTAVIYPIVLSDRLELLVNLPTGLQSIAVPVGAVRVRQAVRDFRRTLADYSTQRYLRHARQLYNWVIRPIEADLIALNIKTLVFVPDGPLRTVPMAALHDGKQFLIHKYALAITPGLELTDPRPLQRDNIQVLATGLTEAVQGFLPLPGVETELNNIQRLYRSKILLNQEFRLANIEKEIQEEQITIFHIASHAQFDRDPQKKHFF